MDVIKKTIYRAVTTSGLTDNHYIIIPDLSAEYHMKFGLTHDAIDMGFFDTESFDKKIMQHRKITLTNKI